MMSPTEKCLPSLAVLFLPCFYILMQNIIHTITTLPFKFFMVFQGKANAYECSFFQLEKAILKLQ